MASPSSQPKPSRPPLTSAPYPYAHAPDIIRAHQKDAYFQGLLTNHLTDLHRRLLGARSAHAWSNESRTLADLLYLCLTTLLGNRTLGEEYCGLVQVESGPPFLSSLFRSGKADGGSGSKDENARQLPSIQRRAAYIAGSILIPYGLTKVLPAIRARIRARLQRNLARAQASSNTNTSSSTKLGSGSKATAQKWSYKAQAYILANLSTLTSPAPVHALSLALFYFSGSYYELAKRLTGLRYIFTSRAQEGNGSDPSSPGGGDRAGYEVLGVLLAIQMSVQAYLHVRSTLQSFSSSAQQLAARERGGTGGGDVNVSLDENAYTTNNAILLTQLGTPGTIASQQTTRVDIAAVTHTPPPPPSAPAPSSKHTHGAGAGDGVRYDLSNESSMRWIKGAQQRKCTLCLEELKDPSATQCGHVFCWACIGDWVREKPECPLCRREALAQHILPLRAF